MSDFNHPSPPPHTPTQTATTPQAALPLDAPADAPRCPKCKAICLPPSGPSDFGSDALATDHPQQTVRCPNGHRMKSWTFAAPAPHQPPAPAPAVVDAVPCTHHPNHAAIAVCDATGDYICSLCAVGIGPHTIGANHLTLDDTQHWLNNRVSRPDRQLASAFGLSFLSLFVCSAIPAPFLYIWGWVAFAQHLKLSRTPGLYAATHTRSTTAKLSIIMLTWTILLAAMGFIFTFAFIG